MEEPIKYIQVKEEDWLRIQKQVVDMAEIVVKLQNRIVELENRLNKNSNNSHKPPSTDGFRKKIQNNRTQSGKKPGGQLGHKGTTLEMTSTPDEIIFHAVGGTCSCGRCLERQPTVDIQRSQVIDLPEKLVYIIEHRIEVKQCKCGMFYYGEEPSITPVKYGAKIKALAVYLNTYGMLSFDRVQEFFHDCFSISIGDGTLVKANESCHNNLEITETLIKQQLMSSSILHSDETGLRCEKSLGWAHVSSNKKFTLYNFHAKRGTEAINDIGILPEYTGVSIHDRWSSYDGYDCEHSLCNAHLLRDLKGLMEQGKPWAKKMIALLLKAKNYKETVRLTKKLKIEIFTAYDKIVSTGLAHEPVVVKLAVKKRGRIIKSDSLRLLETFSTRQDQILRFFTNPEVPFDNNQAERDLRMIKLKQKISGCFRTFDGAEKFCRIRSYISTVRKHGYGVLDSIQNALEGSPVDFQLPTAEQ